jgi:hypothetical protein
MIALFLFVKPPLQPARSEPAGSWPLVFRDQCGELERLTQVDMADLTGSWFGPVCWLRLRLFIGGLTVCDLDDRSDEEAVWDPYLAVFGA